MPLVSLQDVYKSFGPESVLRGASFRVFKEDKVGLIGANGSGKTTIFRLITGEMEPDLGHITRYKGLKIGYVQQNPTFNPEHTILEEMHTGFEALLAMQLRLQEFADQISCSSGQKLQDSMKTYDRLSREFELAGGYDYETKINTILEGVGLEHSLLNARISTLSGGQLSRLSLAKVLAADTDILLLDEPTNHLDLQAINWLEKFIKTCRIPMIIISHDRYLLDRTVTKIVELEHGKATVWKGNYTQYIQNREKHLLHKMRQYQKRVEFVEKTRDFIARNKDQEGMRKTARGRKTRLEKLLKDNPDYLEKPQQLNTIKIEFKNEVKQSQIVLRSEQTAMAFDDLTLFENLTFDVLRGQRLGITGPNGTGKSTLLRLALGQLHPTNGTVYLGPSLKAGYLDQYSETLNHENTALEEIKQARPDLTEESVRGILGSFLFSGDDVFKKIEMLSGGQKSKLMLCKLVLSEPDVLILDEPTNHLDIAGREALESALSNYPGAIIAVSHDRYFLDKLFCRLLVVGSDGFGAKKMGRFEFFDGSQGAYSTYSQALQKRIDQQLSGQKKTAPVKSLKKTAKSKTPEEIKKFNRFSLEQLEEKIFTLEDKITSLKEQFGDEAIYRQPERLTDLQQQLNHHQQELELLYKAYEWRG